MAEYREFTEDELKWIARFKKVMNKAPGSLFLFAGAGALVIYPKSDEGRYMTELGSVDDDAPSVSINTAMDVDGGDW